MMIQHKPNQIKSQNYLLDNKGRLKTKAYGMTLLEVLVAMIILTIGVVALMTVQLRTVAGVKEAEGQTIVAQAVQNMVEGMLATPDATTNTSSATSEIKYNKPTYKNYLGNGSCHKAPSECVSNTDTFFNAKMNAAQLRQAVKCDFINELAAGLPNQSCSYAITESGNDTVVNVSWSEDNDDGKQQTYSYQAKVSK